LNRLTGNWISGFLRVSDGDRGGGEIEMGEIFGWAEIGRHHQQRIFARGKD
jgi:hypothetical protein